MILTIKRIFRIAKQMAKERQDVTGSNCLKGVSGKVIVDEKGIKDSWKKYVEKLVNEENVWDHRISAGVKEGPADCIRIDEVAAALKKMKRHKIPCLSGPVAEMIQATGDIGTQRILGSREVIRWAMCKMGVEEWLVSAVMSLCSDAKTVVRTVYGNSNGFVVKVGMHQHSALSPLLFLMVMVVLSREFRVVLPWELLFADDLVMMAETEDDLLKRLNEWKDNVENRGMRVNMNKTKVISGE